MVEFHPGNSLMTILWVARPQGERLVAVVYPFGHPMLYAYGNQNPCSEQFSCHSLSMIRNKSV
jgi:hypothetical protein